MFAIEMQYSVATVMAFRQLAMMTAMSRDLNTSNCSRRGPHCHWITWSDLVVAQLTYIGVRIDVFITPYMLHTDVFLTPYMLHIVLQLHNDPFTVTLC